MTGTTCPSFRRSAARTARRRRLGQDCSTTRSVQALYGPESTRSRHRQFEHYDRLPAALRAGLPLKQIWILDEPDA